MLNLYIPADLCKGSLEEGCMEYFDKYRSNPIFLIVGFNGIFDAIQSLKGFRIRLIVIPILFFPRDAWMIFGFKGGLYSRGP
jgi:hypothetical protein